MVKKIGYIYESKSSTTKYDLMQDGGSYYWIKDNKKNSINIPSQYQNLKDSISVILTCPLTIKIKNSQVECKDGICKIKK